MAKTIEKEVVIRLRKSGKGIGQISKELNLSKSTVSFWCRDIILTKSQITEIARNTSSRKNAGVLKSAENKRSERIARIKIFEEKGYVKVGSLSKRDLYIAGLALYWGEGYKKGSLETALTNSDPKAILIFIEWLRKIYGIKNEDLILRVSINETHKRRENKVLKYWSTITKIPLNQFTKTSFIKTKSSKIYSNHNVYFGTLRVKVRRSTNLRYEILGSINALGKIS